MVTMLRCCWPSTGCGSGAFRPMHALSPLLVLLFGAATLLLHNQRFIQWKPTVLLWLMASRFLGSFWIGKRTLTERLLGARARRSTCR